MIIKDCQARQNNTAATSDRKELSDRIRQMARERRAVILAHYYTRPEIQGLADFIGDSLALARKAAETQAEVIVMCGVHFMAETCKLLSPEKTVLCPDLEAGCSLADSQPAEALADFKKEHPEALVVSYVNTTAAVKALTDVVVTSGNALRIVSQLPEDREIIFGPDYNLGSYIQQMTGRKMLLWPGGCHVHQRFSVEGILAMKRQYPEAVVMAHLECKGPVLALAEVKGSTADMLRYAQQHPEQTYIVATEAGILAEMKRTCPDTVFLPVPPEVTEGEQLAGSVSAASSCSCNECEYMKLNTLEKLYACLRAGQPQISIDPQIARQAVKPIQRMLEMS